MEQLSLFEYYGKDESGLDWKDFTLRDVLEIYKKMYKKDYIPSNYRLPNFKNQLSANDLLKALVKSFGNSNK